MKDRNKIGIEEKVRLVRQCLAGEISQMEASRQGGVNERAVADWIRQYEAEGIDAFMPRRNRVYCLEMKLAAVKAYLAGEGSLSDICKRFKIRGTSQLRDWLRVYHAHGDLDSRKYSGGGSAMKQSRGTTQAERVEIAKAGLASGKNYGEIAKRYNVSYQQVRTWTLRFEELGEAGLEDRRGKRKKDQAPRSELEKAQIEIAELKHKLYFAEMERDLLKKLDEIERRNASHK